MVQGAKIPNEVPEFDYINHVTYEYRKQKGQFFTPVEIAELMAEWVSQNQNGLKILDPAVGLGIFFRTLLTKDFANRSPFLTGYDIDPDLLLRAQEVFAEKPNVELVCRDYLADGEWDEKYDGIICNPPYLKFHDYDNKEAIRLFEEKGLKMSGFTNIYTLFLLKSLQQLNPGGRMAYIVPSEFMSADYGKQIKKYLLKSGLLRYVIVVDFEVEVFEDVLTTSSILLFAHDEHQKEVEFINVNSLDELKDMTQYVSQYPTDQKKGRVYDIKELDETKKWRMYYQTVNREKYHNLVTFSNYAKVSRGIATGANHYFAFSTEKAEENKIQSKYLVPCLTKAQDVKKHFFTENDFEDLKSRNKNVFLLKLNGFDIKSDAEMQKYIQHGEESGINKRYLTKNRTPWYSMENRAPAPILVTVFNRTGLRFVRNEYGVYNLTAFHCVYVKDDYLPKIDLLMAYLVTNVAKEIFEDSRREYSGGLKKFEPNDLNTAYVVDLEKIAPKQEAEILTLYQDLRKRELTGESITEIVEKLDLIFEKILL